MRHKGENIWIIGASSGIGEALAHYYAKEGASVILSARNKDKLHNVLMRFRSQKGVKAKHQMVPLDICNSNAIRIATASLRTTIGEIDRVIVMAALYQPMKISEMKYEYINKIITTNLTSCMYLSQQIVELFTIQGRGQLAICASVAGFMGLPNSQPYSASKAGLINFVESLRAETDDKIDIRLINPGFVRTPATDKNTFKMPMRIEPEKAARLIAKGLRGKKFELHFPKLFTLRVKLLRHLPYKHALKITKKLR